VNALLLLLLDSRAPAGGHGHSGGMEAAITAGFIANLVDVEAFCRGRLCTDGQVLAAFAAAACTAWSAGADADEWAELDAELSARMPSEAMRSASRQLGGGLRRLLRSMVPAADMTRPWSRCEPPAPHHPLVLGAGVALAGGDPELAARAAALGACSGPASAAVRLLGLDPYAVQRMLARLAPEVDALSRYSVGVRSGSPAGTGREGWASLPANGAPALGLLADHHHSTEARLFAS
jgi:urease accessory protein